MRDLCTFFLICLCTTSIRGQQGYLHLNQPYYFAGEYILYNVYLDAVATDSAVVQIRFGQDQNIISSHFNRVIDKAITGYIKLSHELEGGLYQMQARAFDQDGARSIEFFSQGFTVFDSEQSPNPTYADHDAQRTLTSIPQPLEDLRVDLIPAAGQWKGRVSWKNFAADQVSVSIRQERRTDDQINCRPFSHQLDRTPLMTELPITGSRVLDIEDQNRSPLLYACHPKNLKFALTNVDQEGRFAFKFDDLYGDQLIQFIEYFGIDMDLSVDHFNNLGRAVFKEVADSLIPEMQRQSNERKKIFQMFGNSEMPIDLVELPSLINRYPPDYDYDVQDFDLRGTIVDLIREVSSPLKFRKRKDGYIAKVLYEVGDYKYWFSAPPLFIVNGIALHDVSFVSSLVLQEIRRIRIFSRLETLDKVIGGHRIGGLILIDLIDPLFKIPDELYLPQISISGFQPPIHYPIKLPSDEQTPKISPVIYWDPKHPLMHKQAFEFSCPQPDLSSRYLIEVVAQNEHGEVRVHTYTTEVMPVVK